MTERDLVINLGKLVIAVAWADGELKIEEVNALKDLMFRLPEMTAVEWSELEIYMDSPVLRDEREVLWERVLSSIQNSGHKQLVMSTLRMVTESDATVSPEEAALLEEFERAVNDKSFGVFSQLSRLISGAKTRRVEAYRAGAAREDRIEDYLKNTVFYQLVGEAEAKGVKIQLPEETIRKLCLAAGLMARVAWVDSDVSREEKDAMRDALKTHWGLARHEAQIVTDIAVSRVVKGLDYQRLARSFFEITQPEERRAFIRVLFQIANASEKTSFDEIEEIRKISISLRLHKEYIAAKLTISREDRSGM